MDNKGKKARELIFFLLYISGFVFICSRLVIHQPAYIFWETLLAPPDEAERYLIPRYIFGHGRLPFGWEQEVRIGGYGGSYAYLPGLSYILMAGAIKIVSAFSQLESSYIIAARSVNVLMGVASAVFVWKMGKRIFKDSPAAKLLPVMFMYLPQMIFIHSYVNLDACGILSIVMMCYFLLAMGQDGVSFKNCAGFSVGAVCCLLSYYNCYAFLPGSVGYFVFLFFERKEGKLILKWKDMLRYGCFILLLCILGAGWWFIRSAAVNYGDFLGLASLKAQQLVDRARIGFEVEPSPMQKGQSIFQFLATPGLFFWLFCSFVASYGAMFVYATKGFYTIYFLIFGAGLLAAAAGMVLGFKKVSRDKKCIAFNSMLLSGVVFNFGLWMFYSYAMDFQRQGRYVLPSALALFIWICAGFKAVPLPEKLKKIRPYVITGITAVMLILSIYYIFFTALPAYEDFSLIG